MKNATGKQSRKFDTEELQALAAETDTERFPAWVSRSLRERAEES